MAKIQYAETKEVVERGNSKYILIPATILNINKLEVGNKVKLVADGSKIIITKED